MFATYSGQAKRLCRLVYPCLDPTLAWSLHPVMNMYRPTIDYSRHPTPTSPVHGSGVTSHDKAPHIHYLEFTTLCVWWSTFTCCHVYWSIQEIVFNLSNPDWIRRGTLPPIINDLVMAWPLCLVLDGCHPTNGCSRHLVPTSLLHRLGTYYKPWQGSSHPLPRS